jgi:hypothetical protein
MALSAVWIDEDEDEQEDYADLLLDDVEIKACNVYRDSAASAKRHIDKFFADKVMYCGGAIPKRLLHDPDRVYKAVNYNILKGVSHSYAALRHTITDAERQEARRLGDSTSDVKLVNETLKLLARAGMPRQFAGGMLLMYLELVEGVSFS